MNFFAASVLCACAAATSAVAQGVLPLSQTMRFGEISASFSGPCGWSASPTTAADEGQVTFLPNGTCTGHSNRYSVCPGGLAVPGPTDGGAGAYQVCSDGTLQMRWLPNQPGVDDDTLMLRADGAVMARTRFDDRNGESLVMVGIALSGGHGLGSLNGPYQVVRLLESNAATGLSMQGDVGTIQFDGNGGYSDQGTRYQLSLGGTGSTASYGPRVGTYTVDPDGTLATGAGAMGALSPDGEVFFWMRRSGTDVSLTIGLRQRSVYSAAMAAGSWHLAAMANAIGSTASPVELRTDWGRVNLQPTGSGGGTLDLDVVHIASTPTQTTATPFVASDVFTLTPQGQLTLQSNATPAMPGALSADGSTFAALTIPGDGIGLAVGFAVARWPTPLGTPTAGTGGIPPLVLTVGGFPYTGNATFGFVVAGGRGGALAGLAASGGVSNGLPLFGGLVWLDPNQLLGAYVLPLSGPAGQPGVGAAALPFPVPLVPELGGFRLACQAFTLDPAAPQGVAMSAALELAISR